MNNFQFTEEELKYINADIYDKTQNIYACATSREGKILPTKYNINCDNIPRGRYILSDNVFFHKSTLVAMILGEFINKLENRYCCSEQFEFDIWEDCNFLLTTDYCKQKTVQDIIRSLRTQSVMNARILSKEKEQERLISKDIKSRSTDLGEDYNRESFYSTLNECIVDGTPIAIDPNNNLIDADTISLHSAKLIQDQINIAREKRKLLSLQKQYDKDLKKLNNNAQSLNNQF